MTRSCARARIQIHENQIGPEVVQDPQTRGAGRRLGEDKTEGLQQRKQKLPVHPLVVHNQDTPAFPLITHWPAARNPGAGRHALNLWQEETHPETAPPTGAAVHGQLSPHHIRKHATDGQAQPCATGSLG